MRAHTSTGARACTRARKHANTICWADGLFSAPATRARAYPVSDDEQDAALQPLRIKDKRTPRRRGVVNRAGSGTAPQATPKRRRRANATGGKAGLKLAIQPCALGNQAIRHHIPANNAGSRGMCSKPADQIGRVESWERGFTTLRSANRNVRSGSCAWECTDRRAANRAHGNAQTGLCERKRTDAGNGQKPSVTTSGMRVTLPSILRYASM